MAIKQKLQGDSTNRSQIADELRQLKSMSKGLRTKALEALLKRKADQRSKAKPAILAVKTATSVAA